MNHRSTNGNNNASSGGSKSRHHHSHGQKRSKASKKTHNNDTSTTAIQPPLNQPTSNNESNWLDDDQTWGSQQRFDNCGKKSKQKHNASSIENNAMANSSSVANEANDGWVEANGNDDEPKNDYTQKTSVDQSMDTNAVEREKVILNSNTISSAL